MDMHLFRLNFWISVTDCAKSYPYNVFQTIKHQLKHHLLKQSPPSCLVAPNIWDVAYVFFFVFLHCAVSIFLLLSWLSSADAPFGAVTQLVGSQEGHLARKKLDVGYNIT